jgi:DNA repair exonuclease SbcCD ATPase subunit
MSTSPSWFDQEKFSRLVKKVGPKPVPEAASARPGIEPENRPISGEGLAPTARISLVSKPPSLLSEHRALPALPRRTTSLPTLKALFPYSTPPRQSPPTGAPSTETLPARDEVKEETGVPTDDAHDAAAGAPSSHQGDDLAEVWQKMTQLNEELAHTIQDRDHAVNESNLLREQLHQAKAPGNELRSSTKTQELSLLTNERDQARKEYAAIRKEFETLKQEQTPKEESAKFRKELEQQLEGFRQKLEERNREIAVLKAGSGGVAGGDGDEKLRQEIASLREQLTRAKDEASISQRGLALSQKALQETRDTLREATEGTSLSRHNFDNLKNECATLAQQNTVLQAQNDQLSRELAAAKSKMTSRL